LKKPISAVLLTTTTRDVKSLGDGVEDALSSRGTRKAVNIVTATLQPQQSGNVEPNRQQAVACVSQASHKQLEQGHIGVGAGTTVARMTGKRVPGGFGTWAQNVDKYIMSACIAANAVGCIRDPQSGLIIAGDDFASQANPTTAVAISVCVTDAPLQPTECAQVARIASSGLARVLDPAFTPQDQDIILVISLSGRAGPRSQGANIAQLGRAAAACIERAFVRALETTQS
jgi:L-aminopeptidase/D-esterase-like protein